MSKRRNTLNRKPAMTVAVHEAGHAVAAVHFGIGFDHVTIIPNAEFPQGGRVKMHSVPEYASSPKTKNDPPAMRFWENYLVMTLAGPAAHKKRHPHAHWGSYAMSYLGQYNRLSEDMHSDRDVRNAYYKYIEAPAKAFVEASWYDIEAVARALVERGTLSDEEVRAIAGPRDIGPKGRRMIKLGLTWRDVEGVYLQTTTKRGGDYAVVDLTQLGHRIGYEAHFAPPHSRSVMPVWLSLGVFPDITSAKKRCAAHFLGEPYIPLERSVMPPRAKRKKNRELLLLGFKSCSHRWTSDKAGELQ